MVESDLIPIRPNLVRDRVRVLCDGCIDLKLPSGKSGAALVHSTSVHSIHLITLQSRPVCLRFPPLTRPHNGQKR
ncbi:hypothetical protein RRG08_023975 [Elysia crispata]|uniref:Uncharacterized protein n=1 Tax=Elysia crispata TaxID=231223 RepID=A0AAE0YMU1_9GAST|nr:hypothetical protein RRG08_023975 [Elysia crispata]